MNIEEYPLSDIELNLCPFCKDKAYYVSAVPGCWFVRCGYCRAETNVYQSKAEAALWWNMRDGNGRDKLDEFYNRK